MTESDDNVLTFHSEGLSDQNILAECSSLGDSGAEGGDNLTIKEPLQPHPPPSPPPQPKSFQNVSGDLLQTYRLFLNNQFVDFEKLCNITDRDRMAAKRQ